MYINNRFNRNSQESPNDYFFRNNTMPYYTYDTRQPNFSNITMIQMKNSMLKNQYPKIYFDINSIINDVLPKYRNMTFSEDIVNNIVDEIYALYNENKQNERGEESINKKVAEANNISKKNNLRADDTIEVNQNTSNNLNETENIRKDLIKIILLNRLIKLNLDNINMNFNQDTGFGMSGKFINNPYSNYNNFNNYNNSQFDLDYMDENFESSYMGYTPRNYF